LTTRISNAAGRIQTFDILPVAGALGAEISGLNLGEITDETFAALYPVWLQHEVLFFRKQSLSPKQHVDLGRRFGELHLNVFLPNRKAEGFEEIITLKSGPESPVVAEGWHTDVTFEDKPTKGSVLYGVSVPPFGGDTMWASMSKAYQALSNPMKAFLEGKEAVHDYLASYGATVPLDRQVLIREKRPPVRHPVIRTHPETGKKILFVNRGFTRREIVGLERRESAAIMDFLFDHAARNEFSCRWHWQSGDVAIWDNRATQHTVIGDNLTAPRHMERVTIMGDKPI